MADPIHNAAENMNMLNVMVSQTWPNSYVLFYSFLYIKMNKNSN